MEKKFFFKRCICVDADDPLANKYPFSQFNIIIDSLNQVGIELQWGLTKGMVRLDGWDFTSKRNFKKLLDAVVKLAKDNDYSSIYYLDEISDKDADILSEYGFVPNGGYGINRYFILEVV